MERAGLFVRIPTAQATQLDRAAAKAGMRKQDFVSSLLAAQLDARPPRGATRTSPPDPTATAAALPADDAVLTLDEAATLLRVSGDEVADRARSGELPGRRFGTEWRFSRRALLDWLQGSDGNGRAPGFRRATS
jgi:excisionase family DNA binding protein